MRQVVLDTETTGLEPSQGHRVIEIGAIELIDRRPTGERYHQYINPDREVEQGALEVHGIDDQFLRGKPRFAEISDGFLAFVRGAELIIHNAPFDLGFLNWELSLMNAPQPVLEEQCAVLDTLELAREMHPGMRNSLDALCRRYDVDNSRRDLHGALLDAGILAEVYLRMTGGQTSLALELNSAAAAGGASVGVDVGLERPPVRVLRAAPVELEAHSERLDQLEAKLGEPSVWRRCDAAAVEPVAATGVVSP